MSAAPAPSPAARLLGALGSMRLAVVLLVFLGVLTWLGTLAQVDRGLWDVQREYFESWWLVANLPLSFWGRDLFTLRVPLPGAYPVMALLFVNLLVGGLVRLRWRWQNAGILTVHIGIALLLLAGFVKLEYSYSGRLALYEAPASGARGESPHDERLVESSAFVSFHDYELALLEDRGDRLVERVVPEAPLHAARDGRVVLQPPGLPFAVEVHHWLDNCRALPKGPMAQTDMPVVDGAFLQARAPLKEREANTAGCYVTVRHAGGTVDGILYGVDRRPFDGRWQPFTFTVDGQRYGLDLRRVVYDLPFAVRLDKFQKLDHPGTMTPRDFRSFVTVRDGAEPRQAQIYMNTPLRKDGFVLYQTNWGPQDGSGPPWFSVFEVANNPSDQWPLYACLVIAAGLLVHFVRKLRLFLQSSTRKALQS